MVNHVGNHLSRLIRKRSYAAGDVRQLEFRLQKAGQDLAAAHKRYEELKGALSAAVSLVADLDKEISENSDINVGDIMVRRMTPRRLSCHHGSLTAELVRLLTSDTERVWSTGEIVEHLASKLGMAYETPSEKRFTRKSVTRKLQILASRGVIDRLHDATDNLIGLWRWVGLE